MGNPVGLSDAVKGGAEGLALLVRMQRLLRIRHYSRRTERAYLAWARRFLRFCRTEGSIGYGEKELAAFVDHLAVERRVSAATQNQALSALVFLYREVLELPVERVAHRVRAREGERRPVVLNPVEVRAVIEKLRGRMRLAALLMYGSGLRLNEVLRLRVKDVDLVKGETWCVRARATRTGSRFCPTGSGRRCGRC